tara:strand:- start:208 stop:996 length:789 start_codon:yes stop_codon:yes gene_type:complete
MAINVDTVYKTVLLILNKEQRGYITPDEFNRTATQVQLDIFDQYFEDLNNQLRLPQTDFDYSDKLTDLDDNISPFKTTGDCIYSVDRFNLPVIDAQGNTVINTGAEPSSINQVSFYKLGSVVYTPTVGFPTEIQRLGRTEFYNLQKSDLTTPSPYSPTYLYESEKIIVAPSSIVSGVSTTFIRKPRNVAWGYTRGTVGQYLYSSQTTSSVPTENSTQFELNASEQINVITRILFYSGVIVRDPQIVQVAAQEIQNNETNQKS